MPYNIFTQQNLFQHNHDAYRDGSTTPDGVIVPEGAAAATQPQQPAKLNVPGMDIAQRYASQIMQKQSDGNWHGTNRTAPDGGAMDWIGRTYTYTTPEQEAKYRKQSRARMGILAVGDALRHLGNIYHTTKYAPSQQFNNPVEKEYALYQTQKAQRDKDNYAIATQRLKQAQWEAEQAYRDWRRTHTEANDAQKQQNWETTFDYNKNKDQRNFDATQNWRDYQVKKDDRNFEENKRMHDNTIRHQQVTEGQRAESIGIQRQNANNKGNGSSSTSAGGGYRLSGAYGNLSRKTQMSTQEISTAYNYFRNKGWITDSDDALVNANGQGPIIDQKTKKVIQNPPKVSKLDMVVKMLDKHPEAVGYLSKTFGMDVIEDNRPKPAAQPTAQQKAAAEKAAKEKAAKEKAAQQKAAQQKAAQQKAAQEKAAKEKAAAQKAAQQKAAQQKAAQQKAAQQASGGKTRSGKYSSFDINKIK